jgi:PIN domain nuclease of toxin-antitoxin system
MTSPLLLDTCAAIWIANKEPIAEAVIEEIRRADAGEASIFVSPVSAWEIGMLVSRGRMSLLTSAERWFDDLLQAPGIRLLSLPPRLLIAASYLPGTPPSDPADRIFAASAREYGYTLVTRDQPLLAYAERGHLKALVC